MEQNDCRFRAETALSRELMKEAYGTVMWHSWRAWVNVAAIALGLGVAGYRIYDANLWSMRGYGDAWKNNRIMIIINPIIIIFYIRQNIIYISNIFIKSSISS